MRTTTTFCTRYIECDNSKHVANYLTRNLLVALIERRPQNCTFYYIFYDDKLDTFILFWFYHTVHDLNQFQQTLTFCSSFVKKYPDISSKNKLF